MRSRRSKDVNIFSASVVDLFASGLGVFLIVSIIALVNQKKNDGANSTVDIKNATQELANTSEIKKLKEKILNLNAEVITAKAKFEELKLESSARNKAVNVSFSENKSSKETLKLKQEIAKEQTQINSLSIENSRLKKELAMMRESFEDLKKNYQSKGQQMLTAGKSLQFDFKVGTKVKLQNVHFYAGTDKLIEPYGTEEIKQLATKLLEKPQVKIEVSGHIFLTKKEITKGQGYDESNLSGQRAGVVCDKLIEMGVKENRLTCVGYGGKRYLYLTNDQYSKEAQLNRRVEIEVISD